MIDSNLLLTRVEVTGIGGEQGGSLGTLQCLEAKDGNGGGKEGFPKAVNGELGAGNLNGEKHATNWSSKGNGNTDSNGGGKELLGKGFVVSQFFIRQDHSDARGNVDKGSLFTK